MKDALKKFMRKVWYYIVLIGVGGALKALENIAKYDVFVSLTILGTLAVYLGFSYASHREESNDAVTKALAIQSLPNSKESDWAPLIYESKKRWKGRKTIIYAMLSVLANLLYLGLFVMLTAFSDDESSIENASSPLLFSAIALALKFGWDQYEESLECKDAEELLQAANEGHWIPTPGESKSDDDTQQEAHTVRGILEHTVENLPEECVKIVIESIGE